MSVIAIETYDSRARVVSDDNPSWTIRFKITGTEDEDEVEARAIAELGDEFKDLIRQSLSFTHLGAGVWEGEALYGKKEKKETGATSISFSTQGGSQHITESLRTVNKYAASGVDAPDYSGAIGYNGQDIEGVDVVVPVFSFSVTKYVDAALVSDAYIKNLANLTGTVNNAPFRGFSAGEVLFQGASGAKRGKDDLELTFDFSAAGNQTGLTVGSITGISKKGWEYLWILYQDAVHNGFLIKRPAAVFIEQVYRTADFSAIGL